MRCLRNKRKFPNLIETFKILEHLIKNTLRISYVLPVLVLVGLMPVAFAQEGIPTAEEWCKDQPGVNLIQDSHFVAF